MTYEELVAFWNERDARYGMRKHMGRAQWLSAEEESAIVAYRRSEVDRFLTGSERVRALANLSVWSRPFAR